MEIADLSIGMASSKLAQGVGITMMKKSLEQAEETGRQIIEMMDTVPVHEGSVDISV